MENQKFQPKSFKIPLVLSVVAIVLVVVLGGVLYYLNSAAVADLGKQINQDQSMLVDKLETISADLAELKDDNGDEMTVDDLPEPGDNQDVVPQEQIIEYYNQYQFALTFPSSWVGYTVREVDNDYGGPNAIKTYYFGFFVQDDLFAVTVWEKTEWAKYVAMYPERAPNYKIGENTGLDLVYTFEQGHSTVNQEMEDRFSEIGKIRASFVTGSR